MLFARRRILRASLADDARRMRVSVLLALLPMNPRFRIAVALSSNLSGRRVVLPSQARIHVPDSKEVLGNAFSEVARRLGAIVAETVESAPKTEQTGVK